MEYTESKNLNILTDTSYEGMTQNLVQNETINIDTNNIFGVLLDSALDILGDLSGYDVTETETSFVADTCALPNTMVNGKCTPPEDKTKKYITYGIIAAILIAIAYVIHKNN